MIIEKHRINNIYITKGWYELSFHPHIVTIPQKTYEMLRFYDPSIIEGKKVRVGIDLYEDGVMMESTSNKFTLEIK